ncbi:MAG TPA: acyl carrier protein [Actinocrinis sp.]|uniref:acyl carrier protein n=1 Tax=Actinocrinis sp. TaxID=1920516 RepID=UPI002D65863D|nr:acyl carrier protein [Actinocrinis sp.]HZU56477.1 acyl carrier protein [Actinocrinis sp.]
MKADLLNLPPRQREEALREWLTRRLARYLGRLDIDPGVALAEYGIDSLVALNLYGDVEEELGLPVDVTVVLDYPTVAALAEHLSQQAEDPAVSSPSQPPERSRP